MSAFISPPQLAKRLGVKSLKIIQFIDDGELEAVNLSRGTVPRYRISEEAIQRFLASKSSASKAATAVADPPRRRRKLTTKKYF